MGIDGGLGSNDPDINAMSARFAEERKESLIKLAVTWALAHSRNANSRVTKELQVQLERKAIAYGSYEGITNECKAALRQVRPKRLSKAP